MVSALPGLQSEAARRGWTLVSAAHRACPIGYEPLYMANGSLSPGQCSAVESLHEQLVAAHPDVILWHDLQSTLARRDAAGHLLASGTEAWKADLFAEWTTILDRFQAVGARVVIILPPLRSQQAPSCAGVASQARCLEIQSQDTVIREATREWFTSLTGRDGVYLIEVDSLLCPNGYPCPARVSGLQVRLPGYDQTHFTSAGAEWFAPQVFDLSLAALNGTRGPVASG
jgi:hypothetical protein